MSIFSPSRINHTNGSLYFCGLPISLDQLRRRSNHKRYYDDLEIARMVPVGSSFLYMKTPNPAATTANKRPAVSTLKAPAAALLDVLFAALPVAVPVPVALALATAELSTRLVAALVAVLLATIKVVVP
jgi:hypothetical protein